MNEFRPLISVITPFYNEQRFLKDAVESVLNQDYEHWELLLVDDGSTDSSTEMAKEYARMYPERIRYLEHQDHSNHGLCATRNLGLQYAKGTFTALLDADDVWRKEKLSNQVLIAASHPGLAMVCEASEFWYSWKESVKSDIVIPVGAAQDHLFEPGQLLAILYPLSKGASPCPSSLLIKTEMLKKKGGFENSFTKEYQLYEDQAFLSKIYLEERVYVSSACNNLYRQREGSLVQWIKDEGHYHAVRRFYLNWFKQYLEKKNIHDRRIEKLLKKALKRYEWPRLHYMTYILPRKMKHIVYKIVKG
jgi:glycosyltransferase involved in cell wall biosynthesis